jgi:quercetin dioxygenase-like cupin family protein/DNA-binding XRE family transcriptional regulator
MPVAVKTTRRSAKTGEMRVDVAKTLGGRLRASRKSQRIRLVELAKASGVDAATISRIETGRMTGTLESHLKLARGLGIKLTELYAGIEEAQAKGSVALLPPSARTEVYVHQAGKSSLAMLTTGVLKKKLMPVLITIEPGGSTQKEEAKVGTEKFLYVLDGTLEAKVGEESHVLKRGSTLYFDASLPHSLRNAGEKRARCLAVTTPPVL